MGTDSPKSGATVRTRLSDDEVRRLKEYAQRMGLTGISTALRSLAFENLALKEQVMLEEFHRKKAADEAVKRQLGGQ
tara:strand:- start:440 stop:670 length:231 start_codon:yes stop_codon:yes gene_type:complete